MKDIAARPVPAVVRRPGRAADPRRPRAVAAPPRREGHARSTTSSTRSRSATRPAGSSPPRSPPTAPTSSWCHPGRETSRDRAAHRAACKAASSRRQASHWRSRMSRSRQQVVRMLALVPYLQGNDGIPVNEVAAEFGVTPKHIRDDLRLLMYTGTGEYAGELIDFDLGALEEDGVVHIRDAEFMTRPLRISDQRGRRADRRAPHAARVGQRLRAPVIDSALAKLESAVGDTARPPVDVLLDEVDPTIHTSIVHALANGKRLQLTYATGRATSSPTAPSTRGGCSPSRASSTSRRGACGPRTCGSSGSTGSSSAEVTEIDAEDHDVRGARPVRRHLHGRRGHPVRRGRPASPGALADRVLPGRPARAERRRRLAGQALRRRLGVAAAPRAPQRGSVRVVEPDFLRTGS